MSRVSTQVQAGAVDQSPELDGPQKAQSVLGYLAQTSPE